MMSKLIYEHHEPKYEKIKDLPDYGIINSVNEEEAYSVYMSIDESLFNVHVFTERGIHFESDKTAVFWEKLLIKNASLHLELSVYLMNISKLKKST